MTTTIKVHVNGPYKATIVHTVDGEVKSTLEVGPQEEKSLNMWHNHLNVFTVTEEPVAKDEGRLVPEHGSGP